jgi:hypothetical protein
MVGTSAASGASHQQGTLDQSANQSIVRGDKLEMKRIEVDRAK